MDKIKENLTCPISHQIFYHPVTADDGYTYERDMIQKWLQKNKKSPITKKILDPNKLYYSYNMKKMVDDYLELYPDWKKDQYKVLEPFNAKISEIYHYLKNYQFNELLNIVDFDLTSSYNEINFMKYLFENCENEEVLEHVIENSNKVK